MENELPESPTEAHECACHYGYADPTRSGAGLCAATISADVLGKFDPIVIYHRRGSAFAQCCLELIHPVGLFKTKSIEIAANNSLTEYPAGQFCVIARFKSLEMADRDLRYRADGLERNLPSFALQPQLVAESFHSAPLNVPTQ
jgi:hypothetical protein